MDRPCALLHMMAGRRAGSFRFRTGRGHGERMTRRSTGWPHHRWQTARPSHPRPRRVRSERRSPPGYRSSWR